MEKGGCIYMFTNPNKTVLYIGVTSNLHSRITEHKHKQYPNAFTTKYNCNILVYYETVYTIEEALAREKALKNGIGNGRKGSLMNTIQHGKICLKK